MSSTQEAAPMLASSSEEAISFVCNRDFHRTLILPATSSHEPLRVTFATTTNFSDTSLPAILFCSPMFGTRYAAIERDNFARTEGVRFIYIDRPSMGGSTPVPISQRFTVWLEMVPAVLKKLETPHVYLACHSAGTLYLLQTLYHLRGILWPEKPYAAFIAPWVHNSHSDAMLMQIASRIPSGVINGWSGLNRFINQRIMPATSWSGGIISSVAGLFPGDAASEGESDVTQAELYGVPEEVAKEISQLKTKCIFAENTDAVNEEAKVCLRKPGVDWGVCYDFEEYVKSLGKKEAEIGKNAGSGRLKVRAFFAESDIMIGNQGKKYFNDVWNSNIGDDIDFVGTGLPGTNHETAIGDYKKGALKTAMRDIKALHYQ